MTVPAHAVLSLKAALRTKLLADPDVAALVGTAIHDAPPRGLNPPYLVLGDADWRDNGTVEAGGATIDLDLLAFTSERGTAAALGLAAAVQQALQTPLPPLTAHRLIGLDVRELATRHDPETLITRARLRLRAFTEPL